MLVASRDFEEGEMVLEDNPVGLSPLQVMDGARFRLTIIILELVLILAKRGKKERGTRTTPNSKNPAMTL